MKQQLENILQVFATFMLAVILSTGSSSAGLITGADADHLMMAQGYGNVGWYEIGLSGGGTEFGASGVLIDPHWVLMSAHGALSDDNDVNSLYQSFRFGFGDNFFSNRGENMLASEIYLNSTYAGAGSGYDLALLYFENPFTTVTAAELYRDSIVAGMQGDFAGYGRLQTIGSSTQTLTGDRRAGTDLISRAGFLGPNLFEIRLDQSFRSSGDLLQMKGTQGDSGGGFFINDQLAGIASYTSPGAGGYGDITVFTTIDQQWLNSTMSLHPTTSVPEPSSLLLLTSLIPMALRRRRNLNV